MPTLFCLGGFPKSALASAGALYSEERHQRDCLLVEWPRVHFAGEEFVVAANCVDQSGNTKPADAPNWSRTAVFPGCQPVKAQTQIGGRTEAGPGSSGRHWIRASKGRRT